MLLLNLHEPGHKIRGRPEAHQPKAVLLGVQTLSAPQMCKASTLFETVLAVPLHKGVQQQCPQ